MTKSADILFELLRIALGTDDPSSVISHLSPTTDWEEVKQLAKQQQVEAIAADGLVILSSFGQEVEKGRECGEGGESGEGGVNHLDGSVIPHPSSLIRHSSSVILRVAPNSYSLSMDDLYEWRGSSIVCESDYEERKAVAEKMGLWWKENGIRTIVLKGMAIAQYYPIPEHRYSCDLDVFVGNDWKRSNEILENHGIKISYEQYKDAQFHVDGVYVENHRFITPVRGNKVMQKFERYLRSLLDKGVERINDSCLMVPSMLFNALFLVEHARGHLFEDRLNMRQILDWVVLRGKLTDEDRETFHEAIDRYGFHNFLKMYDSLADLMEGKKGIEELTKTERRVFDEMFALKKKNSSEKSKSLFARRTHLFINILNNNWKYKAFNDCSMPVYLFRKTFTHFFQKEVRL